MRRFRPHRPSPSMTVALIALFVALGGTGYAAANLPKDSVGSKQLKKNAVRSSKVKNRSLLAKDFKAGQLPGGPRGATGPRGAQGPSDAFVRTANLPTTLPTTSDAAVATLSNLPAGSYTLAGTVLLQNDGPAATRAECYFGFPSSRPKAFAQATLPVGPATLVTLPVADGATLTAATNAMTLRCYAGNAGVSEQDASIVATHVGHVIEVRDPFRG